MGEVGLRHTQGDEGVVQQSRDFAFGAASSVIGKSHDHDMVGLGSQGGASKATDVVVAPVARLPYHHQSPLRWHTADGIDDSVKPMGVVGKIHQHFRPPDVEEVTPARVVCRVAMKSLEPTADGCRAETQGFRQANGTQAVGDVMLGCASQRDRDGIDGDDRLFRIALCVNELASTDEAGPPARLTMGKHNGVVGIKAKPAQRVRERPGMGDQVGIVGIENEDAVCVQGFVDDEFGLDQFMEGVDTVFAEMIFCNIGDQGCVGMVKGKATSQDAPARYFE